MKYLKRWLGLEKHSKYVDDYFFRTNMKDCIYMSIVYIILEIWMIIRLTGIIIRDNLFSDFSLYFNKYYFYYILLLGNAIAMLIFSVRFIRGKTNNRALGTALKWIFAIIGLYFGIRVSLNDYAKGEQMLAFITLATFVICLLVWKPYIGFLILTVSYLIYYYKVDQMVPVNIAYKSMLDGTSAPVGATVATKINLFTMWLSSFLICMSNYNNTLIQAEKDENLEKINSHLEKVSVLDELTGIHNMRYFRNEADKLFGVDEPEVEDYVFLFMDIENFKSYNEKYGFHKGNELLMKVAALINDSFGDSIVSRFSDDHFVVLTECKECEQKISALNSEIKKLQGEVRMELKCGAFKPAVGEYDTILSCDRARFACNSIKKHYKRNFRIYDKVLEDKFRIKKYIVNSIDTAIKNDYIKVFYQPVISASSGKICGFEALARWQDPEYGLLAPWQFIETLEEYRQIHKLDMYMVEQVCKDYVHAKENKLPFVPVSVNFSRLDFELCDIVKYLNETVEKYGVPKNFMDIEITESALTEQGDFLTNAIGKLRDSGYKVWLDDFGSGYSSLNVLKDYSFDVLKIDMKFLAGFDDNVRTRQILENIVSLSGQLNMIPLCEGVETPQQYEFLKKIGCNMLQGYLFSKPAVLSDLRNKISNGELDVDDKYML